MPAWMVMVFAGLSVLSMRCGLFEPREAEMPSQSRFHFDQATRSDIVVANLRSVIEEKNVVNYADCFADPAKMRYAFSFVGSEDAVARYANISQWTLADEIAYFRNLVARAKPNGFAGLVLTQKDVQTYGDSVVYSFDYDLTFEHTQVGFPSTARGNMQLALVLDRGTAAWFIYRWRDFKTTNDLTWSSFKGKFSN